MKFSALILASLFAAPAAVAATCSDDQKRIVSINNVRLSGSESTSQLEASLPLTVVGSDGASVTFEVCHDQTDSGRVWTEFSQDFYDSKCIEQDAVGPSGSCQTYIAACQVDKKIAVVDLWSESYQAEQGTSSAISKCCESEATAAKITYELQCECPDATNLRGTGGTRGTGIPVDGTTTTTAATTTARSNIIPTRGEIMTTSGGGGRRRRPTR